MDDNSPIVHEDDRSASPSWQAVIERYYEQLRKGGVKRPAFNQHVQRVESADDLLQQVHGLVPEDCYQRLNPIILSINDFAGAISSTTGTSCRVVGILWGSIKFILKLAKPVLLEILDMFEELGRALPRLRRYGQEFPMTQTLEDAILDTYKEIMEFFAHSIVFFRNNPIITKNRRTWLDFSKSFSQVISTLRRYSRLVDETADIMIIARETNTVNLREESVSMKTNVPQLPCYMIPYKLNRKFFGRSPERDNLAKVVQAQDHKKLRAISIYGIAGVGKTQLALNYANTSMDLYDVVIWVSAESQSKVTKSLSDFATKLGLSTSKDSEDKDQLIQRLRDWLNTSGKTFLLVFDNLEQHELIEPIWPTSTNGSVIITCRSRSLALKRSTEVIHLECFAAETGVEVLCSLSGLQPSCEVDAGAAKELVTLLGGLPLAIVHMCEFMSSHDYSYQELLALYKRSAETVFAGSGVPEEYEHTINTVWNASIQSLSAESKALLNMLAFFDPDQVLESILSDHNAGITEPSLRFLFDDFDFGDAVIGLTKASLAHRSSSNKAILIHRLTQYIVFLRIPAVDKTMYLNYAIRVLSHRFPSTSDERERHRDHISQDTYSSIIPHIIWLKTLAETHSLESTCPGILADLLLRAGIYLHRNGQANLAQSFFHLSTQLDDNVSTGDYMKLCQLPDYSSLEIARPEVTLESEKSPGVTEALQEPIHSSTGLHRPIARRYTI